MQAGRAGEAETVRVAAGGGFAWAGGKGGVGAEGRVIGAMPEKRD